MATNHVMSVGGPLATSGVSVTITHPLLNAGLALTLSGFKLEGTFVNSEQLLDNSKIIALLNGDTLSITNSNTSGSLTFSCTRAQGTIAKGDTVRVATSLVAQGDAQGGIIKIAYIINGQTFYVEFNGCTVKRVPPMILAGNDLPDYSVVFNYGSYTVSAEPAA